MSTVEAAGPLHAPSTSRGPLMNKAAAYLALTKPQIVEQLLITTVPAMFVAQRGLPGIWLMIATVLGGAFTAAGASAANMWYDRDIDAVMKRTSKRPLVTGALTAKQALIFALGLEVLGFLTLAMFVNMLAAVLAISGTLFYVFVYTMWLKRSSPSNIVIGGAAGGVPVLVGWAAVTNEISLAPLVMFAIIFFWTPPHFWALAFKYRDDYSRAQVPMLPSVATVSYTALQIVMYTVLLLALSLLLAPVAQLGVVYIATAILLGAVFLIMALRLQRDHSEKTAMRLFAFSITYVTLLFGSMVLDQFVTLL